MGDLRSLGATLNLNTNQAAVAQLSEQTASLRTQVEVNTNDGAVEIDGVYPNYKNASLAETLILYEVVVKQYIFH